MQMPQRYVVGFCFNSDKTQVALILKNHPAWQAGKLNGIGGKIEVGEIPIFAMIREFEEEAGIHTTMMHWIPFCNINGIHFDLHCYACFDDEVFDNIKAITSEEIVKWHIDNLSLGPSRLIPNVSWLIGMCLDPDFNRITCEVLYHGEPVKGEGNE